MLKTDYKDAMYEGARKYKITANADGTSGIIDETTQPMQPLTACWENRSTLPFWNQPGPAQSRHTPRPWQ